MTLFVVRSCLVVVEAGGAQWVAGLAEQGDSSWDEAAEVTRGLSERAGGRLFGTDGYLGGQGRWQPSLLFH